MKMNLRNAIMLAGLAVGTCIALPAAAQVVVGGGARGGGPADHDSVTGYVCAQPGCATVRMNEASCICTKQNPYESNVKKLKLICETTEQGQSVPCPKRPRYGHMIN